MVARRYIGNTSIIIIKIMTLINDILAATTNEFLKSKIKGDSKILKIIIIKRVIFLILLCY